MRLAVTVKQADRHLGALLEALQKALPPEHVTVFQAPQGVDYSYPFPVVIVDEGPERGRHFGEQAVELLRSFAEGRAS
jgi:hypothetical protein